MKLFRREDCCNVQDYSGHTLENGFESIGSGVDDRMCTYQTGSFHSIQVKDDCRLDSDV